jgi:hypothetical protein
MKFLVNGDFPNSALLKIVLFFTLVYFALLFLTDIFIYAETVGFTYTSVVDHYLGSETEFKNPVSYRGLLESAHFHLFSMALALLLLNHLAAFTGIPKGLKLMLVLVSFSFGLMDILSGWLIRFLSADFAYLKIASFIIFHASFFCLLGISFFSLRVYNKDISSGNHGSGPPH